MYIFLQCERRERDRDRDTETKRDRNIERCPFNCLNLYLFVGGIDSGGAARSLQFLILVLLVRVIFLQLLCHTGHTCLNLVERERGGGGRGRERGGVRERERGGGEGERKWREEER